MANFDGFESKISPLPTNPFGYDGLEIGFSFWIISWADLIFVKKITRPDFWTKNSTH